MLTARPTTKALLEDFLGDLMVEVEVGVDGAVSAETVTVVA